MSNVIVRAVVHDLVRDDVGFSVKLAEKPLEIGTTAQRVIDTLHELYGRRGSKSHGRFSPNTDNFPTSRHLRSYVEDDYNDFAVLTASMMETLRKEAGTRGAAQGGHVFFAHFTRASAHYLLVAIITDKLGAALTNDLGVTDVRHLDIEGFRFAGRIGISAWLADEARYISFLKGKGNVADYFRDFLGCDALVQEREDTKRLIAALKKFAAEKGMSSTEKDEFLKRTKDICQRYSRKREELSLAALANELNPVDPGPLAEALADTDLGLNDNFVPHAQTLSALTRIKASTKNWTLDFDRDAIATGQIVYDKDAHSLLITNLPDAMVRDLEDELDDGTAGL
ncbi:nucleoid-associated protein [Ciceribacter lividus]|uniref:Nucleoid-associated protein n=1 Tax=Ciceribacter lividus TaxID=1197950 RepID=A0A6I7HII4_9HYPH|nr:nucleoid-associated protein [Ciceribacter lividus]RCW21596.1 nucleoid-associated protein [Ciceribacter lividus]